YGAILRKWRIAMPWKGTVMDQRIELVIRAVKERETISSLCREYGISRETAYRWIRRHQKNGSVNELKELSRRPRSSPRKTEDEMEERVIELRQEKGWGARKLNLLLAKQGHSLSTSTISRILVRRGVIPKEPAARHATRRYARAECNQMAQMD